MLIIKHTLAIRTLELDLLGFDSLPLATWGRGEEQKRKGMKISNQTVSTLNF